MNVVDSSGWLEYFAAGKTAAFFAPAIVDTEALIVPVITTYEVFKRVLQQRGEDDALTAVALMSQGRVVEADLELSLAAAKISAQLTLPMADSLILATAREFGATLWTQDADFAAIPDVQYIAKK